MSVDAHKETLSFQTEVKQLLHLMIHSLYSNKEIFLRELISNASDACDKLRFEALTDDALYEADSELKIRVAFDREARTLTIADNGVGMSRQEVMDNIGTIASSGTRKFLAQLSGDQAKDAKLIGQFGVGFYSAFIVADKVSLARKGGGAVAGYEKVKDRLGRGDVRVLLQASDGSERGKSGLSTPEGASYIGWLTADELGRAFARQTTIHAVLGYGGLAQRVVEEAARLKGLRVSDGATARRKGK